MDISNIEVFTQSSIRIRCGAGTIYADPFRMQESPCDADFVLITHDHYDHYSPEDLVKVICPDTVLIVPENLAGKAEALAGQVKAIETVVPGQAYQIAGLSFGTVASYNKIKPFHPKKNRWVGYLLELDGKKVFIAGDTDKTKGNSAVQWGIALVPVCG